MTIIDLMEDRDLLGRLPRFKDQSSWIAWRTFLRAVFGLGLSMTGEEVELFGRCTGRADLPTEEADEAVAIVGRRGGKSQIAAVIAVFLALMKDWTPFLSPGERAFVVVVAQSQKAALNLLRYVRGLLHEVPAFAQMIEAERADEIDLKGRVTIGVWPCTFRATRGLTICAALLDEVDFWFQESLNAAEEVIAGIRPAMASLPGSKLIAISSPYVSTGWLHQFFKGHWAQPGPYLVWKAPSLLMNPTLRPEIVTQAKREDPERAMAEWDAEWRPGLSSLFGDHTLIDRLLRRDPLVLPPVKGVRYVAGVDPSGGGSDEFSWSIAHHDGGAAIVDLLMARGKVGRQGLNLEATVADCAADFKRYGVQVCVGDAYAGDWPTERFAKHGILYEKAKRPKGDLYLDLLPVVTAGQMELPDDAELVKQMKLLQRVRGSRGKDRAEHPIGAHDDRANAATIAVLEARGSAAAMEGAEVIVGWHSSVASTGFFPTRGAELAADRDREAPW